ncbi:hypothetical protein JTB14_007518 [Gonioctena quinquepunctata]|nr:hypothetical protein JTB14_007518 [Gonioctena quinquepunctata]
MNTLPEAAKLNKVLFKDPGAELEELFLPKGGYTLSDGETHAPSEPNTGRLDENGDWSSAKGNIKIPVQCSEAEPVQPEALPSKGKAPDPSTKRTRITTPDDTLHVAERPRPDSKQTGQGATGPRRQHQKIELCTGFLPGGQTNLAFSKEQLTEFLDAVLMVIISNGRKLAPNAVRLNALWWGQLLVTALIVETRNWLHRKLINMRPWEGINLISIDPNRFTLLTTVIRIPQIPPKDKT